MIPGEHDLPVIFLKSEELCIIDRPVVITTVLGSCVSATMYNERLGIAAICHALLPHCMQKGICPVDCDAKYKYVNCVIPEMIKKMQNRGVKTNEIVVKLFGGADMAGSNKMNDINRIGMQNTKAAVKAIQANGLQITKFDVGGLKGRKIFFYTQTGQILLKRLK